MSDPVAKSGPSSFLAEWRAAAPVRRRMRVYRRFRKAQDRWAATGYVMGTRASRRYATAARAYHVYEVLDRSRTYNTKPRS